MFKKLLFILALAAGVGIVNAIDAENDDEQVNQFMVGGAIDGTLALAILAVRRIFRRS